MVYINADTTKFMVENTDSSFLVHKGSFDRISGILNDKSIVSEKFASFSDGIPLVPLHGDSVIFFDKDSLVKNHNFLKIDYNACFNVENKDILTHLMENKSEKELLDEVLKEVEFQEKRLTEQLENVPAHYKIRILSELNNLSEFKKYVKTHTHDYLKGIFSLEKEIVAFSPFNFDLDDISNIISCSWLLKYYEIPLEIKDKIFLIDDYYNAEIDVNSPLASSLKDKIAELNTLGKGNIDMKMFITFHLIDVIILHPEWKSYVKTNRKEGQSVPDRWEVVIKNAHNIPNNELKMHIINYVYRCYTLGEFPKNEKYENSLYDEISTYIKK